MVPITRDQVRQMTIDNAHAVMNHPILWDQLTPEQQALTKAGLQVNQEDNPTINAYFDLLVAAYNAQ